MGNDDAKYRTVKVPEWVYPDILKARSNLALRGIASVPEEVREPETCPNCGGELEGFSVEFHYRRCPKCNYKAAAIGAKGGADFLVPLGIGFLVAMGLTALLTSGSGGSSGGGRGGSRCHPSRSTSTPTGSPRTSW